MDIPDEVPEDTEIGDNTGGEGAEIDTEEFESLDNNLRDAEKAAKQDGDQSAVIDAIKENIKGKNNALKKTYQSIISDIAPEALGDFNEAYDEFSTDVQTVIDNLPIDATLEDVNDAWKEQMKKFTDNIKGDQNFRRGMNSFERVSKGLSDRAWNNLKDVFSDSNKTKIESLREKINTEFTKDEPNIDNINNWTDQINDIVKEAEKALDKKAEGNEEQKSKLQKVLEWSLALGSLGAILYFFIKYATDGGRCKKITGSSTGELTNPIQVGSEQCNCSYQQSSPPSTKYEDICKNQVNQNTAVCKGGALCSQTFDPSSTSSVFYSYDPPSLGGFLGNLVDKSVVQPASSLFGNMGNILTGILGNLKWILIPLLIIAGLLAFYWIYSSFKGKQAATQPKVIVEKSSGN